MSATSGLTLKVLVFERRDQHRLLWRTVGLGPNLEKVVRARHRSRLQQQLRDSLRRDVRRLEAQALATCRRPKDARLVSVPLQLHLKGETRRKVSGSFAFLRETLCLGPGRTQTVLYAPARPDEWLPLRLEEEAPTLWPELLQPYFGQLWGSLDDEELTALRSAPGDRLRLVALDFERPTLASTLKKRHAKNKDFVGAGRRAEAVLDNLAEDESEARRFEDPDALGRPRGAYGGQLLQRVAEPMMSSVLIGPSGSGKSTLIRRLSRDLLQEDGFFIHQEIKKCRRIWRLAGRRLIAGMSYYGQWEQRCLDLLQQIKERREQGRRPILWIEDLHAFGRIGRSRDSDRCLADVFHGPVRRGEVTILGEATAESWQLLEDDAPTFAALFRPLFVEPAGADEALGLLLHEARAQELENGVQVELSALGTLLDTTTAVYGPEAHPARSVELLRGLCSDAFWRDWDGDPPVIDGAAALAAVTKDTGLPTVLLDADRPLSPDRVAAQLRGGVRGQEAAVDTVRRLIATLKAGLTDRSRPFGVLLFTGPTGTGKTETAKYLAAWLYGDAERLLRFDMGEHADPWSTARLVGDRERPEGLLTEAVRARPFSVLLLDEIEKAHPSVLNLLLQVFDEGRLTDAAGRVADFSGTVIVLTSNLGADHRSRAGFGDDPEAVVHEVRRAVEAFFPPELHNRIDRIVPFRPLGPDTVRAIAEDQLQRLLGRRGLVSQGMYVVTDPSVARRVAEEGFSAEHGARAVKRYLDREVGGALARRLAAEGRSDLQMVRLYAPHGPEPWAPRFGARVRSFGEAAPLDGESVLDELLGLPPSRRPDWVLEALLPRVEAVLEVAKPSLEQLGSTDRAAAMDEIRARLEHIAERLDREQVRLRPDEGEILEEEKFSVEHIGAGPFDDPQRLRLVGPRAMDRQGMAPSELLGAAADAELLLDAWHRGEPELDHEVTVELFAVGEGDSRDGAAERLEEEPPPLMAWLLEIMLREPVEVVDFAVDGDDPEPTGERVDAVGRLRRRLLRRRRRVVVRLRGLSAHRRLIVEQGTHELRGAVRGPELVTVRVLRSALPAAQHLTRLEQDKERFLAALLGAGDVVSGEDPELPLPLVRRLSFDVAGAVSREARRSAPLDYSHILEHGGEPFDCEVEDFRLCRLERRRVRHPADLVQPLRLRLQTWKPFAALEVTRRG